jgi:predicted component of type VI protein secretion system
VAQLSRIASWTRVPDRSRIRIGVTGTSSDKLVTAHAFVVRGDGMEEHHPDSELQPGPLDIPFSSPNTYSVLLDLVFATAGQAVVEARVVGPDGTTVIPQDDAPPPTFSSTIAGSINQVVTVSFFITTKKKRS